MMRAAENDLFSWLSRAAPCSRLLRSVSKLTNGRKRGWRRDGICLGHHQWLVTKKLRQHNNKPKLLRFTCNRFKIRGSRTNAIATGPKCGNDYGSLKFCECRFRGPSRPVVGLIPDPVLRGHRRLECIVKLM